MLIICNVPIEVGWCAPYNRNLVRSHEYLLDSMAKMTSNGHCEYKAVTWKL